MQDRALVSRPAEDTVRQFQAETTQLVARRLPLGVALYLAFAAAANALQWLYTPERRAAILIGVGADLLVCGAVVALVRLAPRWARPLTLAGVVILTLRFGLYFVATGSGVEECVIVLIAYLSGLVVVFPWGFRGQALVGFAALLAYALVVIAGMPAVLPIPYSLFALLSAAGLTTLGAHLLGTHRWSASQRALELQQANAVQHEEQMVSDALLRVAAALNDAIREPAALNERIAEHTRHALGADWVTLWTPVPDPDGFRCAAVSGLTPALAQQVQARVLAWQSEAALFRVLAQSGSAELAERDAHRLFACPAIEPLLTFAIAQAVTCEEQMIAILVCAFATRRVPVTTGRRRLLAGIAHQAAMALENARLMEDARGASRTKSEFVATVSHELRTPLNVILGYTDLLMDGAFGPAAADQRDALQRVRQQSMQLLDLIQPMLDLSRLEARGVPISIDAFRISELFADLQASIPASWGKAGVRLTWQLDPAADTVIRTDRGKLEMILRNLVHNALKYTEAGDVTVGATAHIDLGRVSFLVADTGPGIDARDLPAIFDMFQQASASAPRGGGVGLGLYIVKRLTDVLGGQVAVETQHGQGSRFTVSIPMEIPPPPAVRVGGRNGSARLGGNSDP